MSPARPLTVLHLVANRWWTGSAEPVIRLLTGLRARGHRVLLGLIAGDRFEQKAREAGLEPVGGLSLEVRGNPLHALADLRRVRTTVRAEGVDVVHAHHSHDHWLGWLGRGPAALVRTFHNSRAVRLGWPSTALYRRTDALIAVSREIEA
ncbi:MAG: glycosyltransferase family 4 protein, partial [Candidatus Rokuibacteriota bacterium]